MPTTFEQLLYELRVRDVTAWAAVLLPACRAHSVNSPLRMAAFLANAIHETGNLSVLTESLNYTPEALIRQWPSHFTAELARQIGRTAQHPADQRAIAERAYGGRMGNGPEGSGDGWLFRGHGVMQTTGRSNHAAFGKSIGWQKPLEDLPAYLATPQGAADSAAAFWEAAGCNDIADRGDIAAVRRRVNGGSIGLADVAARYPVILAKLHGAASPRPEPAEGATADDLNARELARIRSAA